MIKYNFILSLFFCSILAAQDYTSLKAYKASMKIDAKRALVKSEKTKNQILVEFKDINSFDFYTFEEKYTLDLVFCIAHNRCMFQSKSKKDLESILKNIKEEKTLNFAKIYQHKEVKIY